MSDRIVDVAKVYDENVLVKEHPRSIGLFTIPEYPELEAGRGMWSEAFEAILTTLRYLAPATLLTLFWGQQSFLFKLLKTIDSAFRAIVFSSEEQKEAVLQWLAEAGPVRVEHLDTVWRHGWILCGVLDAALPGACAGHPPTRLSLKHAQSIADHYLGVEPVFSRQELESSDSLSKHQEWKFATYLERVRQALAKVSPPVSKPTSQRTSPETSQFTLDYVARGSGLTAAQVHGKVYFKIFPTAQQCLDPGEVTILIKGPKDTYGMTVLPPILGKAQLIRQKLLGLQSKPNFTENALPLTQGAAYLRSYGKNDMNKTYFIPKEQYDIEIEVDARPDHVKIAYFVNIEGRYEISITSRGQNIVGSPFTVTASHNILGILERDSFCLEDGEEIDIVDIKSDRKVVLRIVDFVTEKMLLKENGSLERITEDEAKILMTTDEIENTDETSSIEDSRSEDVTFSNVEDYIRCNKFNTTAQKILKMNRVCKIFNEIMIEKQNLETRKDTFLRAVSQQDIPDIVNSTFNDIHLKTYVANDKRDKLIIPENISVSLRMEKPTLCKENSANVQNTSNDLEADKIILGDKIEEDIISVMSTSSNPFLNDMYEQSYITEKALGSFVSTEYETNKPQNEETQAVAVNIYVEETDSPSSMNTNPFVDPDILTIERPKTPVLKIITGKVDRGDSVFVNPTIEHLSEDELLGNEFINPFFVHQHRQSTDQENDGQPNVTDFIIGAPVSLPPVLRAPTPEPNMESLMITSEEIIEPQSESTNIEESNIEEIFSTPLHSCVKRVKEHSRFESNPNVSSTFHSLDSNVGENIEVISITTGNKSKLEISDNKRNEYKSITPKKDMWDSAYVSIDDSNSSPDNNNNDNIVLCEIPSKKKFSPSDVCTGLKYEEINNMGPAERELWLSCSELSEDEKAKIEEAKQSKIELKRKMFTPIIEETDRSISSGMKEISGSDTKISHGGFDTVTVAFAELNDMYHEYYPNSETSSVTTFSDLNNSQLSNEIQYTIEKNDIHVDSASEQLSDVKRRAQQLEGKISEVQANVTESVSVSQALPLHENNQAYESVEKVHDEMLFGTENHSNIVLERKKYWDDKIRQIESEENKLNQKKRRLSAKHLRHSDSLTKRRGKQIAKQYLGEANDNVAQNVREIIRQKFPTPQASTEEEVQADVKLVEKWKKYWDEKLDTEKDETDSVCSRTKSPKCTDQTPPAPKTNSAKVTMDKKDKITKDDFEIKSQSLPAKQELPEEVFKAFETSPKRFFGTSRKQILNKLDSFLGKQSAADLSPADGCATKHESGLVSSRISLFHNISQKEDIVPWKQRKSQSMHNIYCRKDSEKSVALADEFSAEEENKSFTFENTAKDNENKTITDAPTNNDNKNATPIKDKRARMAHNIYHKTFDESTCRKEQEHKATEKGVTYVKKTIRNFNSQNQKQSNRVEAAVLCKTTISRSEMDIFTKTNTSEDDLDKYKSCEELPKINVKNFISLYETVSKSAVESKLVRKGSLKYSDSNGVQPVRQNTGTFNKPEFTANSHSPLSLQSTQSSNSSPNSMNSYSSRETKSDIPKSQRHKSWVTSVENQSVDKSLDTTSTDSIDIEIISMQDVDKQGSYLSLSDIDMEIIESNTVSSESSPEREIQPDLKDYKSRFAIAKNYFKSLEELREDKRPPKLNECEMMLYKNSEESLERPQKRVKKNIKAHSMPSSEISKIWNEMQESANGKLVKISEKFNVDDLFNDVTEGKLSRQGSLRGIPHKKAVLETFRSMENVSDSKLSPYEMAVTQLNQFAKENQIKNAQTYLSEYPYLPTTDPSKYHSRFDAKASGLITMKELMNKKPRRNSVPDLRLNPKFTVDL